MVSEGKKDPPMAVLSKTEPYILNVTSGTTIVSFSQLPAKVSGFLHLPDN